MQQSVQRVEQDLAARSVWRTGGRSRAMWRSTLPAPRRFVYADGDINIHRLTGRVLREGQYVGGGIKAHVSRVQHAHAVVMHQFDRGARHRKTKQRNDSFNGCGKPRAIGN
jgi:hypothetical protein